MDSEVTVIAATEKNPIKAAALLIFTKHTRLAMDGAGLADIEHRCFMEPDWMNKELDYMSKTIRSSWEFLDITFSIRNVSRAMAQQMTRTRFTPIDGDLFGSYAMQSQRVTDMSAMGWHNPYDNGSPLHGDYDNYVEEAMASYKELVREGSKLEDARGILPINLHCNLIVKYNLRILCDLVQARSSYRAQGEFNIVAAQMRAALVEMWPWAEMFLRPKDETAKLAMEDLRTAIKAKVVDKISPADLHDIMIKIAKVDDLLQGGK